MTAQRKRVLLVEDDSEMANLYREVLRENFFDCEVVHDASGCLELACTYHPNLILLDLMLPGMSGMGLLRQLKNSQNCKHIPIVILSSLNDDEIAGETLELGAAAYLTKAIPSGQLVSMVREFS